MLMRVLICDAVGLIVNVGLSFTQFYEVSRLQPEFRVRVMRDNEEGNKQIQSLEWEY